MRFSFERFRDVMLVILGVCIVLALLSVSHRIDEVVQTQKTNRQVGISNRVATCLNAVALRQPDLDPCKEPQVARAVDAVRAEVVQIGSAADHHRTQLILCSFMERTQLGMPDACREVLAGG